MSALEREFLTQCKWFKLSPVSQYRLFANLVGSGAGVRKRLKDAGWNDFRYDFAWPDLKLLVEIQGGQWMKKGAHNTGKAMNRDCKKISDAQLAGWNILVFTGDMVSAGEAINTVIRMIDILRGQE